jgi:hypothetical protein
MLGKVKFFLPCYMATLFSISVLTKCHLSYATQKLSLLLSLGIGFFLLSSCDLKPKTERAKQPVYVSPSVDSRGRVRKGYVRKPVSSNKNAVRNQGKSRYYYETRGKYRRK